MKVKLKDILIWTGIAILSVFVIYLGYIKNKKYIQSGYEQGYIDGYNKGIDTFNVILYKHFGDDFKKSDTIGLDIDSFRYTIYKIR